MDSRHQHFIAALDQLRQCGFFEEYAGQPAAQAAASLLADLRRRSADDPWLQAHPEYGWDATVLTQFEEPATAATYKALAAHDHARVWSGDLEADVCAGNGIYAQVVAEYAQLSQGQLVPTAIVETWQSAEGPVTLAFESHGQHFATELAYYDDWIDGEMFGFVDDAMRSQGFTAAIYAEVNTGQDVFLVRATEAEKARMEQALGWSFDWAALASALNDDAE